MKLKSMEITAEEQKERDETMKVDCAPGGYRNRYPYGLELRLDNETLEKLGLDALPKVGKKIRIEAVCMVSGAHVNETTRSGKKAEANRSLELQIQKLGVTTEAGSAEEAVDDALDDLG